MTRADIKQARAWYVNNGYLLQTIADHYRLSVEQLKAEIRL